jgi:hypothetical protein
LSDGYEERSKDEAPPTALGDTHACRAPPRGPRLAREALLVGSQGLHGLNSTIIAESSQIRARPQKGNIMKTERPRAGPERPHHPPHRPPRGPMDAHRWAKAPHDQPTCPSPLAPACHPHTPILTGEKNVMGGFHAERKHEVGQAYGLCMAKTGRARPTAATRAAFGTPSSIVGGMVARRRVGARGSARPRAIDRARKCRKIRI